MSTERRAHVVDGFDPNVRVRGNGTRLGVEQFGTPPAVGDPLVLVESETSTTWPGQVSEVDERRGLVYATVEWGSPAWPQEFACETGDIDPTTVTTYGDDVVVRRFPWTAGTACDSGDHATTVVIRAGVRGPVTGRACECGAVVVRAGRDHR